MEMIKIPKDGSELEYVDTAGYSAIAKELDAELFEIVHPALFSNAGHPEFVLLVDESGALKNDRVVNARASFIYGTHIHGICIYGNALLSKVGPVSDGIDLVPLTDEDVKEILAIVNSTLETI